MDTRKKMKTILNIIDGVELELLKNSTEYLEQFLTEEGVSISKEHDYAASYMKKVQFMVTANANKKKDNELLEVALKRIKDAIIQNATKTSETLLALLHSKTPSIQFRKLDKWTDEEVREVLADVDLVRLMEELDSE